MTTMMNTSKPRRYPSVRGTDDYLTVRAANPRTGMISPSIYNLSRSSSPTKTKTPGTPGEALELYGIDAQERTAAAERAAVVAFAEGADKVELDFAKKALRRAGLKSMLSKIRKKKKDDETLLDQTSTQMAQVADLQQEGCLIGAGVEHEASTSADEAEPENSDRFVVPMPSALEPQPYKYSPAQRQAYSYYLQKTWTAQDAEVGATQEWPNESPWQRPSLETDAVAQPQTPSFDKSDPVTDFERSIAGLEMARRISYGLISAANALANESRGIKRKAVGTGVGGCNTRSQFAAIKWMRQSDWNKLPRIALVHPSEAATPRHEPSVSPFEGNEANAQREEISNGQQGKASLSSNIALSIWSVLTVTVLQLFCTLPSLSDLRRLNRAFDIELSGEVRFQSLRSGLAAAAHMLVVFYTGLCLYEAFKVVLSFVGLLLFPVRIVVRILWWMFES